MFRPLRGHFQVFKMTSERSKHRDFLSLIFISKTFGLPVILTRYVNKSPEKKFTPLHFKRTSNFFHFTFLLFALLGYSVIHSSCYFDRSENRCDRVSVKLAFHADILRALQRVPLPWRIAWQAKRKSVWKAADKPGKTMNSWNISEMFIVLWPILALGFVMRLIYIPSS